MERILATGGECWTFIQTLRYTGMRISDAPLLRAESVRGERIHLYTAKTGVPVYIPIPEFLARELAVKSLQDRLEAEVRPGNRSRSWSG